jgi:deoxyribose-phosphate aldolase
VIIETAYLTDEEKISACSVAKANGADFVKTSTGFGPGGASAKDVALMRSVVGDDVGVKASGGIRDWKMLQEMVQSGATRIGASASVKILQEAKSQEAPSSLPVPVGEGRTGNDYY